MVPHAWVREVQEADIGEPVAFPPDDRLNLLHVTGSGGREPEGNLGQRKSLRLVEGSGGRPYAVGDGSEVLVEVPATGRPE